MYLKVFTRILSIIVLFAAASCTPPAITRTTYQKVEKPPEPLTLTVTVPGTTPAPESPQQQKHGEVTISTEVVPFEVIRKEERIERIAPSENPDLDRYETEVRPRYMIAPEHLGFRVRIRNGQSRILKLRDVPIVFLVDGVQVAVEEDASEEWLSGMIIPGSEREFTLRGPARTALPDSCVIGIFLYDVPVRYNAAGAVTRKENFNWYFYYTLERQQKTEEVRYTYSEKPVHKERCQRCAGEGQVIVRCSRCKGTGHIRTKEGKEVRHLSCRGTGKLRKDCVTCVEGLVAHRKSPDPQIEEQWSGFRIRVETVPPGATILTYDPDAGAMRETATSNAHVDWWMRSTKSTPGKAWPITLVHQGRHCSVMADNGTRAIPKVVVDFTQDPPKVVKGRFVETPAQAQGAPRSP